MSRLAIDVGEVKILVHVQVKNGIAYSFNNADAFATPKTQWFAYFKMGL